MPFGGSVQDCDGLDGEAAAGADALEIPLAAEFEEIGRVMGRPAGGLGWAGVKPRAGKSRTLDAILAAGREELDFAAVGAALAAHGFGDRIAFPARAVKT